MNAKRLYGYDNLRALLIFLVVFAHLLEIYGQAEMLFRPSVGRKCFSLCPQLRSCSWSSS